MDEAPTCGDCGSDELHSVVQYGSFIVMCAQCRSGPTTSFLAIGPRLGTTFRASIVNENWQEIEFVMEGTGEAFANAVISAAASGKLVELKPIAS